MAEPIKIVYFINSLEVGGAEVGMCRLLDGLDPQEYEVTVLALDGHSTSLTAQIPSWVRVVDLQFGSGIGISTIQALFSAIRTADVLVGSLYHSVMIARFSRILRPTATIATWQHNSLFKTNFRKFTFQWTASLSDIILADSEPVSEMLTADLGLDAELVHTVPIAGIDLDEYTRVEHRDREEITVGVVGRLSEQKNHAMVLNVAERLQNKNIQFVIAGQGELYDTLQSEIEERGLQNVTLYGFVESIPSFLAELDIYFQPSRWEGLCITVLEAMAAGLPVVGSNVGGIGRNVDEGVSGYLCTPTDIDGFVSAVEKLAQNMDLRQRYGERARKVVKEKFTQDILVAEFERAIKQ